MSKRLQGSKVMRQRGVDTLITEEPDDRIGHVRICGGDGQQWLSLPGILPIPSGQVITLVKPNWVSANNPGYLGLNGSNNAGLANFTTPICREK